MTAVLKCVPPQDKPKALELSNCSKYFSAEMSLLANVQIILALGKIGFDGCLKYFRKDFDFKMKDYPFKHGIGYQLPSGIMLYGAYHPSPRNVNTKRITFDMMVTFLSKLKNEI